MRAARRRGDDQQRKPRQEGGNGDRGEEQREGGGGVEVLKGGWRNMKEAVVEEVAKGLEELGEVLVEDQQSRQHPVGCVQVVVEGPARSQEEMEYQSAA